MKLEIKEIDGVPVTGIPDGSRTALPQRKKYPDELASVLMAFQNIRSFIT